MVKRPHLSFRIPFFRIFYSTTYTTLFILILILLAITPATLIYTALRASAYQYVFEIGGVYVLVAILTLFIYSSRLYTNRSVLAAVGKSWIPVQPSEVSKHVRHEVVKAANRSALIAFESRPRDLQNELARFKSRTSDSEDEAKVTTIGKFVHVDPQHPPWGRIAHAGWSPPSRLDTNLAPHIHFRTVVQELPNLIEARAVSLAPPDLSLGPPTQDGVAADEQIVSLLSRKPNVDMRAYLGQLSNLGIIHPEAGQDFIQLYEHARFSPMPTTEAEFQTLMTAFADLLVSMNRLPEHVVDMARSHQGSSSDTSSLSSSSSAQSSSSISSSINGSVFRVRLPNSRLPSVYTPRASTPAACTPSATGRATSYSTPHPGTHQTANTIYRTPSQQTFGSVGSVLRTAPRDDDTDGDSLTRQRTFESQRSVIRTPLSSGARTPRR